MSKGLGGRRGAGLSRHPPAGRRAHAGHPQDTGAEPAGRDTHQLSACLATAQKVARGLMALGADGISLCLSNETVGDQDVFHLHFHVVPRYHGLRLGLPPVDPADQEALAEMAARLRAVLDAST